MDENHQNRAESKTTAAEDVKLVFKGLDGQIASTRLQVDQSRQALYELEEQRAFKQTRKSKLWIPDKKPGWGRRQFKNKTLWEGIQLFLQVVGALAVVLTLISLLNNVQQFKVQQKNENDRAIQQQRDEQARTTDQQQQTTLETYLDRMSDLLFVQHLDTSVRGDEVRQVARARTLAAVQNLNPARKKILLLFLYTSRLIQAPAKFDVMDNPIIDLEQTDFSHVDLAGTDLRGVDLSGVTLLGANLNDAKLSEADLSEANLAEVNLSRADLSRTHLRSAHLNDADLSDADLSDADLLGTDLIGAKLDKTIFNLAYYNAKKIVVNDSAGFPLLQVPPTKWPQGFDPQGHVVNEQDTLSGTTLIGHLLIDANLSGADLSDAELSEVNLAEANLSRADLSFADLNGAYLSGARLSSARLDLAILHFADLSNDKGITQQQLDQVYTCKGATLPKGLTCHHNQWL